MLTAAIFTGRPVNAQPADTLSCNADLFGFKLYAEKPLGHFDLLPCSPPKKSRNKADSPTEPSQVLGIDYHPATPSRN